MYARESDDDSRLPPAIGKGIGRAQTNAGNGENGFRGDRGVSRSRQNSRFGRRAAQS